MEIYGADISGIDGQLIKFSATKDEGRSGVTLLGLAQKVVKEGYLRSVKAIETLDGDWSNIIDGQGYTIQFSPPDDPKNSSGLDLPIAIMLLQASILQNLDTLEEQIIGLQKKVDNVGTKKNSAEIKKHLLEAIESLILQRKRILKYRKRIQINKNKYLLIGTFNIVSGEIEAPRYGMFGMIACAKPGFTVIIPEESEIHGAIVDKMMKSIQIIKALDLQEVWNLILNVSPPRKVKYSAKIIQRRKMADYIPDLKAVEGVAHAKRAMMVALAGGHNILLVGPPGQGKSMLSKAATKLLPTMKLSEMFETNKIFSAKGELNENEVILDRPFQEATNNITGPALFGGGFRPPLPGLVSLAHNGILMFDEINLLPSNLIEQLRNALNDKTLKIQRLHSTIEYPCNFIMVAAMNPCKCGWLGHYICPECKQIYYPKPQKCSSHPNGTLLKKCQCRSSEISRFKDKLSQPLLDRIDLKVFLSTYDSDTGKFDYASSTIKRHIEQARKIQRARYMVLRFCSCNASVPDRDQFNKCTPGITPNVMAYIRKIYRNFNLTKRTEVKLLLVSRTIADLNNVLHLRISDVKEAVELMGLNHPYFQS